MRCHPDEQLGKYRLRDTSSIRRYFEANPDEFEAALAEYRAWKWTSDRDPDLKQSRRDAMDRRPRSVGANLYDWYCVLMCASRRRELGISCPSWWDYE